MHVFQSPPLSGRVVSIAGGDRGSVQTVAAMRALVRQRRVDPVIRSTAANLVQFANEKDSFAEISAVFEWVRDHIRYTRDVVGVETLTDPLRTLQVRHGDCDDKSTLLAALLESIGIPTRFVMAAYSADFFQHVYLQAFAKFPDGRRGWVNLDPTERGGVGYAPPGAIRLWIEGT